MQPPRALVETIKQHTHVYVAYSGGMDSHVLLHMTQSLCFALATPLSAVHIDHGLSPQSHHWQRHCATICKKLHVAFIAKTITGLHQDASNLEAKARYARYQAFSTLIPKEGKPVLLLAHHQNDQIETILFHIMRKTGLHALAGIPQERKHQHFMLHRPFLHTQRKALMRYAEKHQLHWLEDPMNKALALSRNRIRHCIHPFLQKTVKNVDAKIINIQKLGQQYCALQDRIALKAIGNPGENWPEQYKLDAFKDLNLPTQNHALRYWLKQLTHVQPNAKHLNALRIQILNSNSNNALHWPWQNHVGKYFDHTLYWLKASQPIQPPMPWPFPYHPITLANGTTYVLELDKSGFHEKKPVTLMLHFRQGGESIQLLHHKHHQPLKEILRAKRIPPWQRPYLPLVYLHDKCIAVGTWPTCHHQGHPSGCIREIIMHKKTRI